MNTPPTVTGFYKFRGTRHASGGAYIPICAAVEVCEVWSGAVRELGVALTGRQARFRLETFEGTWEYIELGGEA